MTKKLWGARFKKPASKSAEKFTQSIGFDKRLALYDIEGSIAHARMLGECKIISLKDSRSIIAGLKKILEKIRSGDFSFDLSSEDIHTNIQNELKSLVGPAADKLHTARSRNDQVALDLRMYCRDIAKDLAYEVSCLERGILSFAKANMDVIIPAYTHLQAAQAILFSHYFLMYVEMLDRDRARLKAAGNYADVMPLGSCALSGTGLGIDRKAVAKELKFSMVSKNSIDSVSDRDFVLDLLSALTILSIHLSRMAEDLILWSTKEFNFIQIDWALCTGSSIMPHKKNPDCLELVRGTAGRILADLNAVLVMLKGLPLSYNRDMQLDKEPLFDAVERTDSMLEIFQELFKGLVINKSVLSAKLADESLYSVDIMEYLIDKGLSYRQAHDCVGVLVKETLDKGKKISQLKLNELKKYSKLFGPEVYELFNAETSVNRKTSYAGTAKKNVLSSIKELERRLKE